MLCKTGQFTLAQVSPEKRLCSPVTTPRYKEEFVLCRYAPSHQLLSICLWPRIFECLDTSCHLGEKIKDLDDLIV